MPLKLNTLYIILFFSVSSLFAQSNAEWNPIGLTASGNNIQSGVEAFYQLNKCNKETVVFIKFINHNNFEVAVEWYDAVFTKDSKWVKNENTAIIKSLTIGVNEVESGDCSDKNKKELVVNVNDFISNIDDFNLFGINSFKVSSINK
jgi:hypothetical protein